MAKKGEKGRPSPPAPLATPTQEPRTGVGTPDEHVEPAGISLGGDTGDVGIPRDVIGEGVGSPHGASAEPKASTVFQGFDKPAKGKRRAA